ncbi:MAG: ferredoxin domain-containing protein [Candidatus Helarchaeota archaeon]
MPQFEGLDSEQEALLTVAKLMLISARTAPKSKGLDTIVSSIINGEEKKKIADQMRTYATQKGDNWYRDAKNIESSTVIVLLGVQGIPIDLKNCGLCGFKTCEGLLDAREKVQDPKPCCTFKQLDLGIALGSAVKTAAIHNVDCRIMYRPGRAAKELGYLPSADLIIAIPLSSSGKNIYFDRS